MRQNQTSGHKQYGRCLQICLYCGFFFHLLTLTTQAQSVLPTPKPYLRDNPMAPEQLRSLLLSTQMGKSVLLARVVELTQHSQPFKQGDMTWEETYTTGRFSVLETVSGPPVAPQIEVDNSDPDAGMRFGNAVVTTRDMRLGEYWLLLYDNRFKW